MQDRRIYQRFDARYPVKHKDTRSDFGNGVLLRDASAAGIKVRSKERLFVNDHVALEVELPDSREPMILKGRVIWVLKQDETAWDAGISFHEVDMFGMARMYKYVDFPAHK